MQNIKIVASDLDGTLLSPEHMLRPFTKKTIKSLKNKGVSFIFATGRHHIDVAQIRNGLGISSYMITSNGARIHNTDGELIMSTSMEPEIARDLYNIVYDIPEILTNIYLDDDWYINRESPEQAQFFQESVFNYKLYHPATLTTSGVSKIYFTCDKHEILVTLEDKINQRWGNKVNVTFSLPTVLEVMDGQVSKGEALKNILKLIGGDLNECIAFGDGMNDYQMLTLSGKGCIMKNAHYKLKEALPDTEVIGSNAEEAVAHYLCKLFE
ncbi:TPA: sugar/pyridoxal phosphate phosphatase YigL [Klebsiella pneumoniae]|nr:sugar/pyridoxal phosphate phosphatase YigL [Klebsiella pneumoniae]